jgi:lia operon protein LiaF
MNKSTAIIGSILIFFGLFFLLKSLDLIWFDFGDVVSVLFPLALIAAGIWLIGRHKKGQGFKATIQFSETPKKEAPESPRQYVPDPSNLAQQQARFAGPPVSPPPPNPSPSSEESSKEAPSGQAGGKLRFNKMLGDMFVDCEGFNLGNVEISGGVGDVEIKVSGGVLSKGLNRMIISGFIGDIRIFVPRDFSFFAHCSNFVGDIDIGGKRASGFGNTIEHQSPNYDKAESKLYIASNSFIGDMKIYQV